MPRAWSNSTFFRRYTLLAFLFVGNTITRGDSMNEYNKSSHAIYDIKYHIIWVTKYRYHVLNGNIALRVRELIRQGC